MDFKINYYNITTFVHVKEVLYIRQLQLRINPTHQAVVRAGECRKEL